MPLLSRDCIEQIAYFSWTNPDILKGKNDPKVLKGEGTNEKIVILKLKSSQKRGHRSPFALPCFWLLLTKQTKQATKKYVE